MKKTEYEIVLEEYKISYQIYFDLYKKANVLLVFLTAIIVASCNALTRELDELLIEPSSAKNVVMFLLSALGIGPFIVAVICLFGVLRTQYIERIKFEPSDEDGNTTDEDDETTDANNYKSATEEMINTIFCLNKKTEEKSKKYDCAVILSEIGFIVVVIEILMLRCI